MKSVWMQLKRSKTGLMGLMIIIPMFLMALLAPFIAISDPEDSDIMHSRENPSFAHPFGTDALGRDIFSRIVYGSRPSLLVGFGAIGIGGVIGIPLGLFAGYHGGKGDTLIRSLADLMLSFPSFLLALSLVAILGVGLRNVIISVGISTVPIYIRLVRGEVMSIRENEYVLAAKGLGRGGLAIIFQHIFRNVFSLILVQSTIYMGMTLLTAAGLGFLGLGVQSPTPEWGAMLGRGRTYIYAAPHLTIFPGLAIFFTVLGLNLLGDSLRDALDPHLS